MSHTLGVVHVLVASEASENGLSKQSGEGVSPVLAGAGVAIDVASTTDNMGVYPDTT